MDGCLANAHAEHSVKIPFADEEKLATLPIMNLDEFYAQK
jgi:hypothetical protein